MKYHANVTNVAVIISENIDSNNNDVSTLKVARELRNYLPATGDVSNQFHFIPLHVIIRVQLLQIMTNDFFFMDGFAVSVLCLHFYS